MARLFAPTVLLIACASIAAAQPLPPALVEPHTRDGAVEASPPLLAGLAVRMDDALRDDGSGKSLLAKGSTPMRRRHGDSLLNGALIGAGVGTVLCVVYFHEEVPAASLPLIVGFYALAGAWIDARIEAVPRPGIGTGLQPPAGHARMRASVNARLRF